MGYVLKPKNEGGDKHPKKQQAKAQRRLMVNPTRVSRRRAARIRSKASGVKLTIHPGRIHENKKRPDSFDKQRNRMADDLGCDVVRHAA